MADYFQLGKIIHVEISMAHNRKPRYFNVTKQCKKGQTRLGAILFATLIFAISYGIIIEGS